MPDGSTKGQDFIEQAEAIILDNLSDERFGVSELAEAMNTSRSNLLRKIKKHNQLSASQFIRQVRLKRSMELLRQTSLTVSEVSYQVGFGSTSYYIKCFREYYGHPPGDVGKGLAKEEVEDVIDKKLAKLNLWRVLVGAVLIILVIWLAFFNQRLGAEKPLEKSIAVLPFKNDSNDSSNVYFINGLQESTLTNLQKIRDLRVISRTSVEKYRDTDKAIPEIAQELQVSYFVEGSGQKIGDRVLLNIQLIEASTDKHIWAEQYSREVTDIFVIQNEVATKIAEAVEAIVTPAELEQIVKEPTESLEAYDYYLQAAGPYLSQTKEGLEKAIPLLEKAIEYDPQFALAYARLAISYHFLDLFQIDKQYTEQINNYADKALLYDSRSEESLIAKAFYYINTGEYRLALPHLEKALEYNPNSSFAVQMLTDFYLRFSPNATKHLEYALKGIQLDIAANDSVGKSYIYLQLGAALVESGFVEEAIERINQSLDYYPQNPYSAYIKAHMLFIRDRNLDSTLELMRKEWKKDTSRLELLQEVAKYHYYAERYDSALFYYQKFVKLREQSRMDIYGNEDLKIGISYEKMGFPEEASHFFKSYAEHYENDRSIYKSAGLAALYVHEGDSEQAIEQLNTFAGQDNYQYWMILQLETDPLMRSMRGQPAFDAAMQLIKDRFWANHDRLKASLEEKGLL